MIANANSGMSNTRDKLYLNTCINYSQSVIVTDVQGKSVLIVIL